MNALSLLLKNFLFLRNLNIAALVMGDYFNFHEFFILRGKNLLKQNIQYLKIKKHKLALFELKLTNLIKGSKMIFSAFINMYIINFTFIIIESV